MASNHQLRPPLVEWFAARPVGLLVGFTVTGWLAAMLWPNLLRTLGILGYENTQFLDSYAVLAAVDAVRAGANPHGPNALDPLMRGHVYSDWWLALRWLGLTRAHNFLVGHTWITGFALTVWVTARPRQICETFWLAALLLSPPFFLAVERANNDLVIFILLAGCGWAVSSPASARPSSAPRAPITTSAPARTKTRAMPWPIPLLPPVMIVTLSKSVIAGEYTVIMYTYSLIDPRLWRPTAFNFDPNGRPVTESWCPMLPCARRRVC